MCVFHAQDRHKLDFQQFALTLTPGGGGGLLKYDLGRDVPLRLEK